MGIVADEPIDESLEESMDSKVLCLLRDNPSITYNDIDISNALSVSRSTVKRAISALSESGRIIRVGGKRFGHWEIK